MAIVHVQSGGAASSGGTSNSFSFTFGAPVGSGHTVCVFVFASDVTASLTLTDDKSNTYTLVTSATISSAGLWVYFSNNITNGPQTITATSSGALFELMGGDEFSGVSQRQDGFNANAASPNPPTTTGPWATTLNGDLIWGAVQIDGTYVWGHGTGFTTGYGGPSSGILGGGTLYQVQATASPTTQVTALVNFPGYIAGFALGPILTVTLAANDAVETAAFTLAVKDSFALAANDVVETASFTVIDLNSLSLAANDVVELAAFSAVIIPASTSAYSIIPLTGT